MVASLNSDLYSPFQRAMPTEDSLQSSEEGSGLHSPVFGDVFPPPHGDSFRYQHDRFDVQRAAGILAPQYDYATALNAQQVPFLDTTLEAPDSSAQHVTFSPHFPMTLPHRNQLCLNFPVQSLANARFIPAYGGGHIDFKDTSSSGRRLPGGLSHDYLYSRHPGMPAVPTDGNRNPPPMSSAERTEPSSSAVASDSPELRKEISTVVIACRQCRGRKIRCDSTRPVCHNCVRRSNVCEYDAVPKRRGPDKHPGTRQRSCKKRPADGSVPPPSKRKRTDNPSDTREAAQSKAKENMASAKQSSSSPSRLPDRPHDLHPQGQDQHDATAPAELQVSTGTVPLTKSTAPRRHHLPYGYEHGSFAKPSYPRQLDVNIPRSPNVSHHKFPIPSSPAIETDQKLWWDNFTISYPLKDIERDLIYLFKDTGYWLSFLHIDFFRKILWSEDRLHIQPSFILAGLALATLMKSSEFEYKSPGRERASWLRDAAQVALEQAWASEWIDATLAEAALILALYESSAHPHHSADRVASSLLFLDNIIRTLALTTIDINDRDVALFPSGCVPMVHTDGGPDDSPTRKCTCLPTGAIQPPNPFTSSSYTLPWDSSWTDSQIRDEECRRLCWSALGLVCSYNSQCVAFNREPLNFFLSNSGNYAILFPGEVLDRMSPSYRSADSPSTKESVWALYCRSMLLWNFCNHLRLNTGHSDAQVESIFDAWAESQALQDSLRTHNCNLDTAIMYMCREYIYNTQLTITQTLRSLQGLASESPAFKRKQAEEWLRYQDRVIQGVKSAANHLGGAQGYQLTRRPFQATWFSNQLSICLLLWNYDRSLKNALVLAKSILLPMEVMNALWPCPTLQRQSDDLRQRLIEACTLTGLEPPIPTNYTLPSL